MRAARCGRHDLDVVGIARHLPGAAEAIDAIVPRAIAAGVGGDDALSDVGPAPETERIAEVVLRKGQYVFRGRVLANYAHACAFCGLRSRLPEENDARLLVDADLSRRTPSWMVRG